MTPSPALHRTRRRAAADLRPQVPRLVAAIVRVSALLTLAAALRGSLRRDLDSLGPATAAGLLFALAAASAGVQLVLARGLRLRKRRAWQLTVPVTLAGAALHATTGAWRAAVLNGLLAVLLVATRRDFTAQSGPSSRWLAVRAFLLMAGASLVAGLLLVRRTAEDAPFGRMLVETLYGLVGATPDLPFRRQALSDTTATALGVLGLMTLLVTVGVLLRPRPAVAQLTPEDEQRLRALLASHGDRDSLGYFALRRDKAAVFSPSGKAAVAHRAVGGVDLASGDPLGDPEAWPGAIRAWLAQAFAEGRVPGVLGCGEAAAEIYRREGFDALELGDEAVLDLREFHLEGRTMRPVRQAVNRVERAGYTVQVRRQRDLTAAELDEVQAAVHAFRDGEVERGFSMALGRLGDPADPDLLLVSARDREGRLVAVLAFVPWGSRGLSLDLMRRSRDSENGSVEFLVVAAATAARELGVERISLNFAVFRSAFERGGRIGAGPVLRLWRQLLLVLSKWWQIESLYRANAKYQPQWVPRFVCFRRLGDLPRIGVAGLEAEAFVTRPRLGRLLGL